MVRNRGIVHKIIILIIIVLTLTENSTFVENPEWINRLPFTDDAFWGVGGASTIEEAKLLAKQEILMQMSRHIEAVIKMETGSSSLARKSSEHIKAFFSGNSLRGAELMIK